MQCHRIVITLCSLVVGAVCAEKSIDLYRGVSKIPNIIKEAITIGNNGHGNANVDPNDVLQIKSEWFNQLAEAMIALIDRLECGDRIRKGETVIAKDGVVPPGAVESGGGPNIPPYYLARTFVDGTNNLLPCKLTAAHRTCWAAWNKTEVKSMEYEVLINADVRWIATTASKPIPPRSIAFGYRTTPDGSRETLYVGRAPIGNFTVPGYVFAENRTLLHSSSFKNELKSTYEILVGM
ncbi:hypothetical protein B566_EDAN001935 [Ephemera danica]|nr:hypothetical protein B566_EDAN001935 [Ephemera danica]